MYITISITQHLLTVHTCTYKSQIPDSLITLSDEQQDLG